MTSIGLRATPKEIFYSIVENNDGYRVITSTKLNVPMSMNFPDRLSFIRKTFMDIIDEYKVSVAGIRISESNAQKTSIDRISIEAILQELLVSSSVNSYFIGQIASISSKIGFNRENFKKYISGEMDFSDIEGWSKYKENQKESIFSAISSFNK